MKRLLKKSFSKRQHPIPSVGKTQTTSSHFEDICEESSEVEVSCLSSSSSLPSSKQKQILKKQCSDYIAHKPRIVSYVPPPPHFFPDTDTAIASTSTDTIPSVAPALAYGGCYTSRSPKTPSESYTHINKSPLAENILVMKRDDGKLVVFKISKQNSLSTQPFRLHEIYIHQELSDAINSKCYGYDNIVLYIDHFVKSTFTTSELCLVMEYCELGCLFDFINESVDVLPSVVLRSLTKDIVAGVHYLHASSIIHRDIKPENMFLTLDQKNRRVVVKLGDFGFSNFHNRQNFCAERNPPGSLEYAAPEILQHREKDPYATDIFALGVSFFLLLERAHLFGDEEIRGLDSRYCRSILTELIVTNSRQPYKQLSSDYLYLRELINSMTDPDYRKRPTIAEIRRASWFKGINKKVLTSELYYDQIKQTNQEEETDDSLVTFDSSASSSLIE